MGLCGEAATYYSKTSGAANQTTTWGLSTDGTGTSPINFSEIGDIFILTSSSSLGLNGNWIIGSDVTLQVDGWIVVAENDHDITIEGTIIFTKSASAQVSLVGLGNGNNFTLGGTATLKTANQYGICGSNCSLPTTASGTIILPSTANYEFIGADQSMTGLPATVNNLTLSGSGLKTLAGALTVDGILTINTDVTLSTSATSLSLTLKGNFIKKGELIAGSSSVTISGAANQNIAGFTTNGSVSMNKSGGIATFMGNVNGNTLTINGSGGTLHLGADLTHIFTGNWYRPAGKLIGGSSLLKIGGNIAGSVGGTFTAETGTVEYFSSNQTCAVFSYNNLTLSGSGTKTFATSPTVNGILSMEGNASVVVTNGAVTYGTHATLQYNTTIDRIVTSKEWITPFIASGGIIITNTGCIKLDGAKTLNDNVPLTINNGATFNAYTFSNIFSSSSTVTINGTFITGKSAGLSGQPESAISSTNNPTITLGNNSQIEYLGGDQLISSGTYNNLSILGNGMRTISSESAVTVNGSLITNDKLAINSDAVNSGSLIIGSIGTSTGKVTYNRWLDHTNMKTTSPIFPGFSRWYITSAPVKVTSGFDANSPKIHQDASANDVYDFATYTEVGNAGWQYLSTIPSSLNNPSVPTDPLNPGHGYLISLNPTSNGMIQFTGTLNNGDVSPTVTSSGLNGWNAVGNPYTSAIKVVGTIGSGSFLDVNSTKLTPSYAAIYVWNEPTMAGTTLYDESQQYYRVIGNAGYVSPVAEATLLSDVNNIQAGQGFLINTLSTVTSVTFNKSMQVPATSLILKSAEVSWPGLTLLAESHGQTRSTVVAFNEQMTTGLDVTYDAGLLASDVFQVYTHLVGGGNTVDFAIQCLPDNRYSELTVPVGVDLPQGGELVFKASGIILPLGLYPVIEDRLLGIRTTLKTEDDSYTVTLVENTRGTGRFYLSVEGSTLWNPTVKQEKKFTANFFNDRITINGAVEPGTKALLFDICGRKVGEYPLENRNRNEITLSGLSQRVYLLKIEGKTYTEALKVIAVKY